VRKLPIYPESYQMPVESVTALPYDEDCTRCPLHFGVNERCMKAQGTAGGLLIVVDSPTSEDERAGKPLSGFLRTEIERYLKEVKYTGPVAYDSALRCSLPSVLPDKKGLTKGVTECTPFTKHTLDTMKPKRIIVCGPLAAWVVLGRTVDAYSARRGVAWLGDGTPVFWLPHPQRHSNRFFRDRFFADLQWAATVDLATLQRPPRDAFCRVVESLDDALDAETMARACGGFAFDVETCGVLFDTYWRVLCTATVPLGTDTAHVWPEKVLENPAVFAVYKRMFETASLRKVGQNVKFDCKAIGWRYKIKVLGVIDDTLLIRRALFSDARGDLATLAELVGMGGHKLEFQVLLKQAKALIVSTRSKIKAGKLTSDRIGANIAAPTTGKKKAAPPADCPDIEVLRQACERVEQDVDAFSYGLVAAMSPETLYRYCALDGISTARVYAQSYEELKAARHPDPVTGKYGKGPALFEHYDKLIRHLTATLVQMETWGMPISLERLDATDKFISARAAEKLAVLQSYKPGLNPGSNQQLAVYLYEELKLPILKPLKEKLTDGPSVEAGILQRLADKHPFVPVLLEWRQLEKLKGAFVDNLRRSRTQAGRVHSTLNPGGTKTGRLSATRPNLQQLSSGKKGLKEEGLMIKSMFRPSEDDWVILQLDFSQLELRVAALLCADPLMAQVFKSGQDFHRSTAKLVAPLAWGIAPEMVTDDHRSMVKAVVFGLLYGMTDGGLARRLGCSVAEAARLRAAIFGGFPALHTWYNTCHAYAKKWGRCLTFWKGAPARRRPLFDIADPSSYEGGREFLTAAGSKARNAAVNTPVQGSASDFMLMALIEIVAAMLLHAWPARLIMSVHDSAIAECKRTFAPWLCAYMKHTMESQGWGDVPIVVDAEAGPSWGDLSKMDVWLADFFGLPKGCKLEVGLGPRVRVTRLDGSKTEWLTGAAAETHDGFNEAVRGILNELGMGETR
jgi:DNA polymerase I-like protein with 3'-5' exonuclease and polymerase domains/uracil-DNA glycosylase